MLRNWLNNISKPNPKYIQDKLQYERAQTRNKTILVIEAFLILFFMAQLFRDPNQAAGCINAILFSSLIIAVLIVSCHTHPEVFNISFNVIVAAFGAAQAFTDVSIHYSWKGVDTYPIIVLVFTGSIIHCILHACFQLILLKLLYEPALLRTLTFIPPETFAKNFTEISTISGPLYIVIVAFLLLSLQNQNRRKSGLEKKKDKFERQKVFILGFSHELRNLINSIVGNMNLAKLESTSSKGKNFLTNAEFCGKLLLHLVNNILDTGKAEVGDLEINIRPTKIYDTLENIWSICSELIKRKNLKGKMTIQKNIPPLLNMDPCRLTQIFLNLIGNAVKFTDNGSININIEWLPDVLGVNDRCFEPKPFNDENELEEGNFEKSRNFSILDQNSLELNVFQSEINKNLLNPPRSPQKGVLKVIVSDTGVGIDQDSLEKVFHKFTPVNIDKNKRKLGTGLGLFITKELCNRMEGDIKMYSKPKKGTCVIFCIPMQVIPYSNQRTETIRMMSSSITMRNERLKAMIVDDIEFCRDVLKDYLKKLRVEVIATVENGLEAHKKFIEISRNNNDLNIIIMDLEMPVMNGKEAARRIREFEIENGLEPCFMIIASGNSSLTEMQECLDKRGYIKADVFLKKPLMIDEVSRILSEYFNPGKRF